MSRPRRVPVAEIWYRVPSALRALALIAMWFSYAALLSNLNSLDDGGRTAEIIWGACALGTAITALVDMSKPACFASLDELFTYRTALRTGKLPGSIDIAVWRCHLLRSRIAAALAPVFFLPYLAFGALSADSSQSPHRVLLLWAFGLSAIGVLVATVVQGTRIKELESQVRQQQQRRRAEAARQGSRTQQLWKSNAETPRAERVISTVVASSVLAFIPLLLADLDAVVYSDARGTHLTWAALCATAIGAAVTGTVFGDPRMRATSRTIDAILDYDRAYSTSELPGHFDVDQWRGWIKSHHRSDVVTLIWAFFYLAVAGWLLLNHPPGYHWVVATLLVALAIWQIRRWQYLCALNTRLKTVVERHAIRQLFG